MLLSIIIATKNSEKFIKECLNNLFNQEVPKNLKLEALIIDGNSSDNTVHIAKQYPVHKIISESDKGAGDAYNKGIKLASGDFIFFLNSDDLLGSKTFIDFYKKAKQNKNIDIWTGQVRNINYETNEVISEVNAPEDLYISMKTIFGSPQLNARFYKTKFIKKIKFNNWFCNDRLFLYELWKLGPREAMLETISCIYRYHDQAATHNLNNRSWVLKNHKHIDIILDKVFREQKGPKILKQAKYYQKKNYANFLYNALSLKQYDIAGKIFVKGLTKCPKYLTIFSRMVFDFIKKN